MGSIMMFCLLNNIFLFEELKNAVCCNSFFCYCTCTEGTFHCVFILCDFTVFIPVSAGPMKREEVDPRLLIPVGDRLCWCLPHSLRQSLCCRAKKPKVKSRVNVTLRTTYNQSREVTLYIQKKKSRDTENTQSREETLCRPVTLNI